MTKTCTKCGLEKDLETGFNKSKVGRLGRHSLCKKCAYAKSKEWIENNRERASELIRNYRKSNLAKVKERKRQWEEKNPDKVKEIARRGYLKRREKALEYKRNRRNENPEREREQCRKSYQKNRERYLESSRERRRQNPEKGMERHRKLLYKLTKQDTERMLVEQHNKCLVCSEDISAKFCVDHDHACCSGSKSCGKCVRGLLCSGCNVGLGRLKDDVEVLKKAVQYLENWNLKQQERDGTT